LENPPTRRFVHAYKTEREAKKLVSEIIGPVGERQAEVAWLAQLLNRENDKATRQRALLRCQAILDDVRHRHMMLLKELNGAPDQLRQHSRVDDAVRALNSLEQMAAGIIRETRT
jgi:hypothetical protein